MKSIVYRFRMATNFWLVERAAFILPIDKNHQEKGRQERDGKASGPPRQPEDETAAQFVLEQIGRWDSFIVLVDTGL